MIGIGITTRNRVNVLDLCLEKFAQHLPKEEFEFWIVDDCSDPVSAAGLIQNYSEILSKYPFVNYYRNENRLGIAKSKNECLKRLKNCDHIFLFDDDAFPVSDDWYQFFIDHSNRTGIQHFLYQFPVPWLGSYEERDGILSFVNSSGVMMYITKKVLETIGGYDARMGIYGFEHSNYSMRAYNAGLMNGFGPYCSPVGSQDHIFSLDLDMNCMGRRPPHRPDYHLDKYEFVSSLEGEQDKIQGYINHNMQYLYSNEIWKDYD